MSLIVGLTGGIASGKSTACLIFKEMGAYIVDADQVSRDVVRPSSPAWKEIVEAFGREILKEDNEIDRARLAGIIFSSAERRLLLEKITHPRIIAEIDRRVEDLQRDHPGGVIIVDAALMIEAGLHKNFERNIVVFADEETQSSRLMERDSLGRTATFSRIEAQMPLTEKTKIADYVIDNSGSVENTRAEVERIYRELKKLATQKGSAPGS